AAACGLDRRGAGAGGGRAGGAEAAGPGRAGGRAGGGRRRARVNGAMQLALGGPVVIKSIGPVNLYLFGTAAAAGCVAGLAAALALARRYGFAAEQVLEVAAPALLAGIAGARIGYVLLHWPDYRWDLAALWRLSEGGFFFYGGLAAGLLAAALAAGRRGMDVRRLLDVLAPGLAL